MYRYHTTCRACGYGPGITADGIKSGTSNERLEPVFSLGAQPLANDFCKPTDDMAGFAPLQVLLCPRCNLAQLSVVVDPRVLYSTYRYVTSNSRTMREHFQRILDIFPLASHPAKILEIGSNDGLFLQFLKDKGHHVMGVDPASNLCAKATQAGLDVFCDFWTERVGREVASWQPEIIVARHVFCHVDDWKDFIRGIEFASGPDTVTCIEVPYVGDLLRKGEFDTIYHEHTSYLSLKAMSALLEQTNLRLLRVDSLEIHGGAILIQIGRKDTTRYPHKSVSEFLNHENCDREAWREFDLKCHAKIGALQAFVDHCKSNGKRIVGYGASAKSTVWINACGFSRKQIDFISDTTPEKQWRLSPGTDIPIVDEGSITRDLPDVAILFAWNYLEEVMEKEKLFLTNGGKFVVPHPDIKIVP